VLVNLLVGLGLRLLEPLRAVCVSVVRGGYAQARAFSTICIASFSASRSV